MSFCVLCVTFASSASGCPPSLQSCPMQSQPKSSMSQVLLCGAAVVTLSMGGRHGFGLWLQPITQAQGWTRDTFAFAIAIQNLAWGLAGIFAGMVADRFGAFRVLIVGAICYSF